MHALPRSARLTDRRARAGWSGSARESHLSMMAAPPGRAQPPQRGVGMSETLAASQESAQAFAVHVRRETGRFAEVAARSPLQAHVPAYPAFTVETLSAHIGRALRIFPAIISGDSYGHDEVIEAPTGPAVIEWVEAGLDPFLTVLAETPPDTLVALPH